MTTPGEHILLDFSPDEAEQRDTLDLEWYDVRQSLNQAESTAKSAKARVKELTERLESLTARRACQIADARARAQQARHAADDDTNNGEEDQDTDGSGADDETSTEPHITTDPVTPPDENEQWAWECDDPTARPALPAPAIDAEYTPSAETETIEETASQEPEGLVQPWPEEQEVA